MAERIGFIGVGIMGLPMARNLLKAGCPLIVCDITTDRVALLVREGAERRSTPAEVARDCRTIILMLPDGPEVEAVALGRDGIIEGVQEGALVVDMSSIAPQTTVRVGAALKKAGATLIDAPVSGGEPGAIAGTLAIMVGGPEAEVRRARPILEKMGKSVVRVGDLGSGQVAKLVNQVLVALHIHAMAEAFALAVKSGAEPGTVFEAIKGGLAGSNVLSAKMPMVLARNFKPGFRMRLHRKDLKNALATAKELGLRLPVTEIVFQSLDKLVNQGKGEQDHCGLVQAIEELNNLRIES